MSNDQESSANTGQASLLMTDTSPRHCSASFVSKIELWRVESAEDFLPATPASLPPTSNACQSWSALSISPNHRPNKPDVLRMTAAERRHYLTSIQPETRQPEKRHWAAGVLPSNSSTSIFARLTWAATGLQTNPLEQKIQKTISYKELRTWLRYEGLPLFKIDLLFPVKVLQVPVVVDLAPVRYLVNADRASLFANDALIATTNTWMTQMEECLAPFKTELREIEEAMMMMPKAVKEVRWEIPQAPMWVLKAIRNSIKQVQRQSLENGMGHILFQEVDLVNHVSFASRDQ